jgi:hypothetical protein
MPRSRGAHYGSIRRPSVEQSLAFTSYDQLSGVISFSMYNDQRVTGSSPLIG